MEPIALDMIDPKSIWIIEDESLDDLRQLRTQPGNLSGTLVFDTPNMLASQLSPETSGLGVTSVANPSSFKSMLGILKDET